MVASGLFFWVCFSLFLILVYVISVGFFSYVRPYFKLTYSIYD